MEQVLPVLQIDDYDEALNFYRTGLGFEILMEHRHEPGFPVFMIVKKGDLEIGLSEHGRGHQGSEIYLYVHDIEAWHQRCLANEISPESSPTAMPWGNTEMLIIDPSRNVLRLTQRRTHEGKNTPNR